MKWMLAFLPLIAFTAAHAQNPIYEEGVIGTYYKEFYWDMSVNPRTIVSLTNTTLPFAREKIIGISVVIKNDNSTRVYNLSRLQKNGRGAACSVADTTAGGNYEFEYFDPEIWAGGRFILHLDLDIWQGDPPEPYTLYTSFFNNNTNNAAGNYDSEEIIRGYIKVDYLTN